MLKKNLQKIHLHRSIKQTLGSLRGLSTKTLIETSMLSIQSKYQNLGQSIEQLTSGQRIQLLYYGSQPMETRIGSLLENITKLDRQLISMQAELIRVRTILDVL